MVAFVAVLAVGVTPSLAFAKKVVGIPIQHVIIIMQENRSFDHYFGTFPGANGFPRGTCVPLNPSEPGLGCVKPFHDPHDINAGAAHGAEAAQVDLDDGVTTTKMDGFVYQQSIAKAKDCNPQHPNCGAWKDGIPRHDTVGYHTDEEIPNYWAYARHFVLQEQLFEAVRSWSWPSHLYLASEWSAACTDNSRISTCSTKPEPPKPASGTSLPWVNLFQLLDVKGVSWKYYLGTGDEPDCEDDEMSCDPQIQAAGVASIWNPAPFFAWVKSQGHQYLLDHNPNVDQFLVDVKNGTLPSVSWIAPAQVYGEHPPAGITAGMEYVTSLVNAIMQSAYWQNTAIFIAWDDWGGFYDHVAPPNVDENNTTTPIQGFGLRVPGLMISAYAKAGMIHNQVLSFDSYATFIEDVFMGGARLDPVALGNPDSRPDIRDALTEVQFPSGRRAPIGNLMNEFDFTQQPLPPLVLSTHIPTGISIICSANRSEHCTTPTVKVLWEPVTGPGVPGPFIYHIQRDGVELPQCVGVVNSCTDQPGSGAHLYRVYSVDSQQVASPLSAAAEADEP